MKIKGILDTDHVNYKKLSMTIMFPKCSFKCDHECGQAVCQNSPLVNEPDIDISYEKIVDRYMNNPLTEAIVFQGLEPFDSTEDVYELVKAFRNVTNDDIVIYTGYTEEECDWHIGYFKDFPLRNSNVYLFPRPTLFINAALLVPNSMKSFSTFRGIFRLIS